MEPISFEKLELYLSYDFMPINQYAGIIYSLNEVFKNVLWLPNFIDNPVLFENFQGYPPYEYPLCINQIHSGDSIKAEFSFSKGFFPNIKIENDNLKIILPYWSAALILAGQILSYGIDKYDQYLDIEIKQMELHEKVSAEIKSKSAEIISLKKDGTNPLFISLLESVTNFKSQINQLNIHSARINGITLSK